MLCDGKREHAFAKYPSLLELEKCHSVNLGHAYTTADSAKLFTSFIAKTQQQSFFNSLYSSGTRFFSLLMDGTSDTFNVAQVQSMDDDCGEWVECMGVASGCGEQEVGVASGSGWNLWVWLLGVVVRRYIDFLILLIPTPLVSVLFCSSIPTFCSLKKRVIYIILK